MWASYKRRHCFAAAVLCLAISSPTTATSQTDLPAQFVSIKEFLIDTVSESQRVGAATTYKLLRENLAAFRNLKMRVDHAVRVDDMIEELSAELDTIASNFEQAARLRSDYAKHTRQNDHNLEDKRRQTRAAIIEIERRIGVVQSELDTARISSVPSMTKEDHDRNQSS